MPNELLIAEIETIMSEVVELGASSERTRMVPNLLVTDSNPGLVGFIVVKDDRDSDNILARKVPGVIYSDNDLVNVLFIRGGEAIAFQQGSQSTNSGIWEIVPSTTTDIYYNKGDVGIGKAVAPDAALEVLDAVQAQLRLTFEEDTKFVDLTLDTNHDLTITPSSTGQIILQPTTDSVDFFQVLDADGGDPVLNVDSINERVGIGTAAPDSPLHLTKTVTSASGAERLMKIAGTFDGAGAGAGGMAISPIHTPSASVNFVVGAIYNTKVDPPAGVTITNAYSFFSRVDSGNDTGSVTTAHGVYVSNPFLGTLKPTTIRGITVANQGETGVTTSVGLHIEAQSNSTNNYAATILGEVGIGTTSPAAKLHIDQASTTAAIPVLSLDQADLSEEFINLITTVGAGNPVDTAAIGTYYGKARVAVNGTFKYVALYNS